MKRVAMIAAGGTIAMVPRHAFDWVDYADSGIVRDAHDLAGQFDHVLADVELVPVSFRALGSVAIGWADWCELLETAEGLLANDPGICGIVVTHGTATLEETAFFLELTWTGAVPIALVGAQRPIGTHGSDAIASVRAAMAAVTAPGLSGNRVYVVMNGEIYRPTEVTKSANFLVDAFSATLGPIARVGADGQVAMLRPPPGPLTRHLQAVGPVPRVDIIASYAGADRVAIDAAIDAGCRGIVMLALPPGRVASGQRKALVEAAAAGIVVVIASRALRDALPLQDFNLRDGILVAGSLPAHKARILLMLALGEHWSATQIQTLLLEHR